MSIDQMHISQEVLRLWAWCYSCAMPQAMLRQLRRCPIDLT
ncbi:hypothetical protein [uncultured Porphyromonas sp.]|nr:hypothetical protein [uncultured Porphyromonas sp.]